MENKSSSKKYLLFGGIGLFAVIVVASLIFLLFPSQPAPPPSVPKNEQANQTYEIQHSLMSRLEAKLASQHGYVLAKGRIEEAVVKVQEQELPQLRVHLGFSQVDDIKLLDVLTQFAQEEGLQKNVHRYAAADQATGDHPLYQVQFFKMEEPQGELIVELPQYITVDTGDDRQAKPILPQPAVPTRIKPAPGEEGFGKLAIIIDDFGNNLDTFDRFLNLKYDITYSILPSLPFTEHVAEAVHKRGREIILHQPMEPKNTQLHRPGPGALYLTDSPEAIQEKLATNFGAVRYAVGVNNHMGSAFTQHAQGLQAVMKYLGPRNLFFVDSKTSAGRIAQNSASQYSVPYLARNIFLDNDQDVSKTTVQFTKAVHIAQKYGHAIAIGHPYSTTVAMLERQLPHLKSLKVTVVPVSALIR